MGMMTQYHQSTVSSYNGDSIPNATVMCNSSGKFQCFGPLFSVPMTDIELQILQQSSSYRGPSLGQSVIEDIISGLAVSLDNMGNGASIHQWAMAMWRLISLDPQRT